VLSSSLFALNIFSRFSFSAAQADESHRAANKDYKEDGKELRTPVQSRYSWSD
jgi:hypothetical protein